MSQRGQTIHAVGPQVSGKKKSITTPATVIHHSGESTSSSVQDVPAELQPCCWPPCHRRASDLSNSLPHSIHLSRYVKVILCPFEQAATARVSSA